MWVSWPGERWESREVEIVQSLPPLTVSAHGYVHTYHWHHEKIATFRFVVPEQVL